MPRTKLNDMLDKMEALKEKKVSGHKRRIDGLKITLTTQDFKKFCDTVFMCYVRFRDGWICTLTGKKFDEGDFSKYQACHFIPKSHLAGRYLPENCHGQSAWCNYQEALGNPVWVARYTDFMTQKYGRKVVEELFALNSVHTTWKMKDWEEKAKEVCILAFSLENGKKNTEKRLNAVYDTLKEQKILDLIKSRIDYDHL